MYIQSLREAQKNRGKMCCGAFEGFVFNDNDEEVPVGCGGTMLEINKKDAYKSVQRG